MSDTLKREDGVLIGKHDADGLRGADELRLHIDGDRIRAVCWFVGQERPSPVDVDYERVPGAADKLRALLASRPSPETEAKRYPGQGHPWADFLHHRARVLAQWRDEGKTLGEMVTAIQMDATQARLIVMTVDDNPGEYGRAEPNKGE